MGVPWTGWAPVVAGGGASNIGMDDRGSDNFAIVLLIRSASWADGRSAD